MRFLVIGASGRSGKLVLNEAIGRGHHAVALVRNNSSLQERRGLTIVTGSPLNTADIARALASSDTPIDAIIFTMNARRVSDSPFAAPDPVNSPPRLMEDSMRNTLAAMKAAPSAVRKIVVMSSVGTGNSWNNVNFLMRLVFEYTNMRHSREDHDAVDHELRNTAGITFVEVRPWMLTEGEVAETKMYADHGKGAGFMPKISRASVAKFLVEAAETSKYDGMSPVITN